MSLPSKPPQSLRAVGLVPGMFLSPFTPPGPSCRMAIKAATAVGDGDDGDVQAIVVSCPIRSKDLSWWW